MKEFIVPRWYHVELWDGTLKSYALYIESAREFT
ncbi:hypothetical protein BVRB_5g101720 [Beta vulgaris subsp. vulgaris]|nr:hypothetical protein BVRB_5g101720 [Beta vulgaris subsp. vulgaris]